MTEQVVLGFDFGLRRIGVALGNSITRHARALQVIAAPNAAARWQEITTILEQWHPARIVIGVPRHPDGAAHEMTRSAERFGRRIAGRYRLPVEFVDERYSSAVLDARMADDAHAAAVILQQWFDEGGVTNIEPFAPTPASPPQAEEGRFESSRLKRDEES